MPAQRRLWDSAIVLGYLAGYEELRPMCLQIIQQAQQGEVEIIVSEMAKVESAYLAGRPDAESEDLIKEFFSREYIIPVSVDDPISTIARGLVRKHRGLTPPDAIHLDTAILWHVPVIETTDPDLLRLDQQEGNPPITIRKHYMRDLRCSQAWKDHQRPNTVEEKARALVKSCGNSLPG